MLPVHPVRGSCGSSAVSWIEWKAEFGERREKSMEMRLYGMADTKAAAQAENGLPRFERAYVGCCYIEVVRRGP